MVIIDRSRRLVDDKWHKKKLGRELNTSNLEVSYAIVYDVRPAEELFP